MAFITVLARRKTVSTFQLGSTTSVGRSMDCDLYIPDVFMSRVHCRFVLRDGQWYIRDADSRNGVWVQGQRVEFYLLKPGDLIELGTIAIRFNAGDAEGPSHPAPLGLGLGVTELMETVYAHDMRPAEYAKAQKTRKLEYAERMKRRMAEAPAEETFAAAGVDLEPWKREEWAELDMELQLAEGQNAMTDWQPPIFNPKRAAALAATAGAATGNMAAAVSRKMDSIDEEVELRVAETRRSQPKSQPAPESHAGITFEQYTWRDRAMDAAKERLRKMRTFSKLNPQLAAGIAIGAAVLLYAAVKFAPIRSGPHFYVPPDEVAAQSK